MSLITKVVELEEELDKARTSEMLMRLNLQRFNNGPCGARPNVNDASKIGRGLTTPIVYLDYYQLLCD